MSRKPVIIALAILAPVLVLLSWLYFCHPHILLGVVVGCFVGTIQMFRSAS